MYKKPIRVTTDTTDRRICDAIYNDNGEPYAVEIKVQRERLVVTLAAIIAQLEAGKIEATQASATKKER